MENLFPGRVNHTVRHNPSREPKFHHVLILEGEGRSIKALFTILKRGGIGWNTSQTLALSH